MKTDKERRRFLKQELKEYEKATSMTDEERNALREWVRDGNSVHEKAAMAVYEGGRPIDFLDVYREEEEIRRAMERSSAKAGDGAGAEKLSGKLPLRESRAELRPDGKEISGFFREMNLYESILGDLPVCVCEGKLICQA